MKNLSNPSTSSVLEVVVPNPICSANKDCPPIHAGAAMTVTGGGVLEHLVPVNRCSSLSRLVAVHGRVLGFVDKLKQRLKQSDSHKYAHLQCSSGENLDKVAWQQIVKRGLEIYFKDCVDYFNMRSPTQRDMPNVVGQINLIPDEHQILRVNIKFNRAKFKALPTFPVLQSRESALTKLLIADCHTQSIFFVARCIIMQHYVTNLYNTMQHYVIRGDISPHFRRFIAVNDRFCGDNLIGI